MFISIPLTTPDNETININPAHITYYKPCTDSDKQTEVHLVSGITIQVQEAPERITRLCKGAAETLTRLR